MIGLKNKLRESEEYFKYLRGFNVKHAQIVIGNILHYLQDNIQLMKKNYSFYSEKTRSRVLFYIDPKKPKLVSLKEKLFSLDISINPILFSL